MSFPDRAKILFIRAPRGWERQIPWEKSSLWNLQWGRFSSPFSPCESTGKKLGTTLPPMKGSLAFGKQTPSLSFREITKKGHAVNEKYFSEGQKARTGAFSRPFPLSKSARAARALPHFRLHLHSIRLMPSILSISCRIFSKPWGVRRRRWKSAVISLLSRSFLKMNSVTVA